jgi:hypothetical protein
MSSPARSSAKLRAVPAVPAPRESAAVDDIWIARKRMRHLLPWNVKPLPVMHFAASSTAVAKPRSEESTRRVRHLAMQVLAVQMWHASARSLLQT